MVEFVDSKAELFENLRAVRDDWCADPASFPDSELHGFAGWAWKCRLEGRLFSGRDSEFLMHRLSLDALRGQPASADAIVLLVVLTDLHGHAPGRQFPLDFVRMRAAGLIDLSVPRLCAARKRLEEVGLLRRTGQYRAGSRPQTFVLTRLRPGLVDAKNVVVLGAGEPGGRVQDYL